MSGEEYKIRLLAYDSESNLRTDVISGEIFDIMSNYIILVNKAIPKYSKVFIEIEITDCDVDPSIRHLPLMLGISKEPSWGFLNSDYCLGSIYYTKNTWSPEVNPLSYLAFRMIEKYAGYDPIVSFQSEIQSLVPLKHSCIGIGVDMSNNTINLYSDGKLLYGFSPERFSLNDTSNIYFALCCQEINKHIKGIFRFRSNFMKSFSALQDQYTALYDELYLRNKSNIDIETRITIGKRYLNNTYDNDIFLGNVNIENDIAPINLEYHRRDLEIIVNKDAMKYYNDLNYTMQNKHAFKYSPRILDPDIAYVNFPLDKLKRLYFEFTCSSANIINDYVGIPLSIGLTPDPSFPEYSSVKINLFHLRTDGYHIIYHKEGFEYILGFYDIQNIIYPKQPSTIGILSDLANNTIEMYIEGILFGSIKIDKDLLDFSLVENPAYIYFEAAPANVFSRSGEVICNFGTKDAISPNYTDKDFRFFTFENVQSLWEYYNSMKEPYYNGLDRDVDFFSTIKVISDRLVYGKNIFCRIIVPDESESTPGLNKLWQTYNTVSDTQTKQNVPDKTIFDIQALIDEDKISNTR